MAGCGCDAGGSCVSTRCSCRRSGQACGALCDCSRAAEAGDGTSVAGPSACTNTLHALLQQQAPRLRRPGISVPADLLRPYSRQPVRGGRRPPDPAAAVQAVAGAAAASIAAAALPPHASLHHLHDSSRDSGAGTSSSSSSGSEWGGGSVRVPHQSGHDYPTTTNRHMDFVPPPRSSSNNADIARPNTATQHQHQQQQQQRQRPATPCRYFAAGCCRFGAECNFSHDQAAANRPARERPQTPVCVYFVSGNCRNGDSCMFRHVYPIPTPSEQQAPVAATVTTTITPCVVPDANIGTACASEDEGPDTCGVCFEDVQKAKKRFGLLTECDHCFCLECLRTWRQREGQELSVVRSCPACRKLSHFVVPSATFCKGEEKQRVIAAYKATLAKQPCRYYQSLGTCRFGPYCFYAHVDSDGTDAKPKQAQDWSKRAERRRRREEQAQQQRRRAISAAHVLGGGAGTGDGSNASDVSNTFQRMLEMLEELYSETESVSELLSQGDWLDDEDYGYSSEDLE